MTIILLCLLAIWNGFADGCGSIIYYETEISSGGGTNPPPSPPPGDSGDEGRSSGVDGNVKRVEVSLAGQNSWQHAFSIYSGQGTDIEVKLTNKGGVAINDAEVEYYLSDNLTFNEAIDIRLGQDTGIDIPAGGSVTKHLRGIVLLQPGTYYVFCKIEALDDHNSSNNFSRNDDAEEYAVITVLPLVAPEDEYLVGDWDGDGRDNTAVRRNDHFYLDYNFDPLADFIQHYGNGK